MKKMTKEWVKDIELHELIVALTPNTNKKVPFVFMNGGTDCVAKDDLHTVKTNFNMSERENEISFIMLPDTFDLKIDFLIDGEEINETACRNDFLLQYLNRLRVISYIPDNILKSVKDKRLLALGYAEQKAKDEILNYTKSKCNNAYEVHEKCNETSVEAQAGLTINKQIDIYHSVPFLFDNAEITEYKKVKDEIHMTLDDDTKLIFSGAEVIEKEIDLVDCVAYGIELYEMQDCHELHILLQKMGEDLIYRYYYATYKFKDLKLKGKPFSLSDYIKFKE